MGVPRERNLRLASLLPWLIVGCPAPAESIDSAADTQTETTAELTTHGPLADSSSSNSTTAQPEREPTGSTATSLGSSDESPDDTTGTTGADKELPPTPFVATEFLAPYDTVFASWGPGNAWGDINGDGWLDLVTAGGHDPSHVYINQGDGSFAIWPGEGLLATLDLTVGITVADFDNDGWSDIYVLRFGENVLLRNLDGLGLADLSEYSGLGNGYLSTSAAWGDYDRDGRLDVYVTNAELEPDALYHANDDGTFTDVSWLVAPPDDYQTFSAVWLDYDDDADLDLFVSNDKQVGNRLWRNDGVGCLVWCFTDVALAEQVAMEEWSMGVAVGDYDGDLDLDLVLTDIGDVDLLRNLRAEGSESFVHASVEAGIGEVGVGWGLFLFDYDNDGWLDLYVADSLLSEPFTNLLYHNLGDGTFDNISASSGCDDPGYSFGVTYADYDEDGTLDIVASVRHEGHRLYRGTQQWPDRHWLTVDLVGAGPINRDAVGARVWVTTDSGRTMMQEVKLGSSVASNSSRRLHFGLGLEHLAAVTIRWPDGLVERPAIPPEDQRWVHAYPAP